MAAANLPAAAQDIDVQRGPVTANAFAAAVQDDDSLVGDVSSSSLETSS